MKTLSIVVLVFVIAGAAAAQRKSKGQSCTSGSVYGEIVINEASGNNLSGFTCGHLIVEIRKLGGGWEHSSGGVGNFSSRRCSFKVTDIPPDQTFVAVLKTYFLMGCDQKSFETTTSFPMKLKTKEELRYNFAVSKISCVKLK